MPLKKLSRYPQERKLCPQMLGLLLFPVFLQPEVLSEGSQAGAGQHKRGDREYSPEDRQVIGLSSRNRPHIYAQSRQGGGSEYG